MKKRICLTICLLMLLPLCGCLNAGEYAVQFYYPRNPDTYEFGTQADVITSERRTFPTPVNDPEYLMQLYLDGPVSENLINPFPEGTKLLNLHLNDKTLTIVLSSEFAALEDMELTIASACLTNTCFQITGAEQLVLAYGNHQHTHTRESFLFLDDSATPTQ